MDVRIRSAFATIILRPWYEAGLDVARPALGLTELRSLIASERGINHALRRLVVDVGAGELEWCSDEELIHQLAGLIERGRVCVVIEPRSLIYTQTPDESAPPAQVVDPIALADEARHWIEVQLVGEDDEGIGGVRCQIVLPNGQTIVRETDRFGLVRVDGVEEADDCEISFLDLDSEAWEAVAD